MNAPEMSPNLQLPEQACEKLKALYVKPELKLYGDVVELTRSGNSLCGNDGTGCMTTGTMGMA